MQASTISIPTRWSTQIFRKYKMGLLTAVADGSSSRSCVLSTVKPGTATTLITAVTHSSDAVKSSRSDILTG